MFNSVAFDVVIGLVFVYLLYSLLTTILGEMIMNWLGIRARILRLSIERMLNDGYYKKLETREVDKQTRFDKFTLQEHKKFKESFAGDFYDYPSIKFLSKVESTEKGWFGHSKPSYISAGDFADTVINLLKARGVGKDDISKIKFALQYKTRNVQPETAKHISDIIAASNDNIDVFRSKLMEWFENTQDRASGWFKNKLRIILFSLGFLLAIVFNINSIQIAKILAKDKEARTKLVDMSVAFAKDSSRYATYITSKGDTVHKADLIDSSYKHISADINASNLVLGAGWGLDKLVDDSQKINYTSNTKAVDDYLALSTLGNSVKNRLAEINKLSGRLFIKSSDTLIRSIEIRNLRQAGNSKAADSLQLVRNKEVENIQSIKDSISVLLLQNRQDSVFITDGRPYLVAATDFINTATKNYFTTIDGARIDGDKLVVIGKRHLSRCEKWGIFFYGFFSWSSIIGFILTALALSLGAPFWFDLLGKLVSIRSGGVKPERASDKQNPVDENKGGAAASNTDGSAAFSPANYSKLTEDPVLLAIAINKQALMGIPGVIAVNKDYCEQNGTSTECIEVTVNKLCDQTLIPDKYDVFFNGSNVTVPVIKRIGAIGQLHNAKDALQPKNPALGLSNNYIAPGEELQNWGTASGIVMSTDINAEVILSAAHVLQGDNKYNSVDGTTSIIAWDNRPIGTLMAQYTTPSADTGWVKPADTSFTSNLKRITTPKVVQSADAKAKLPVKMSGFISGDVTGVVLADSVDFPFYYSHDTMVMEDMLKVGVRKNDGTFMALSQPGDSGALVTDMTGNPIGIIVGGTSEFSYVIKFTTIFNSLTNIKHV